MDQILISHDAGWYEPSQPAKAIQPYTPIFETLIPNLQAKGFTPADIGPVAGRESGKSVHSEETIN